MSELLALVIVLILTWSWVCVTAGRIYEVRRRLRELNQLEANQ